MIKFSHLDRQAVNVQIAIGGRCTMLSGVGRYLVDPELGNVLRITFAPEAGGTAILLQESSWSGMIDPAVDGQPYLIRLDTATAPVKDLAGR